MLDCIENTVLTNVFRGELIIVAFASFKRHCIMHVVAILLVPIVQVLYEAIQVVATRTLKSAVSILLFNFF